MSRFKRIVFIAFGISLFFQNSYAQNAPVATAKLQNTAQTSTHFVRTFTGLIANNINIQMRLRRNSNEFSGWYVYTKGEKFYKPYAGSLYLSGTIDESGKFMLEEQDDAGKKTGVFKGIVKMVEIARENIYEMSGTWQKDEASEPKSFTAQTERFALGSGRFLVEQEISEESDKYIISILTPSISGSSIRHEFLKAIDDFITPLYTAFKNDEAEREPLDTTEFGSMKSGLDVNYDVMYADSNLISIRFIISQYEAGAAHPMNYSETINFDMRSGKVLKIGDVFKSGKEFLKTVSTYARHDLLKRKVSDKDWIETGTSPAEPDNFNSWNITQKGILLTFDQYQVASYAAGPQEVLLPYSVVKGLLKSGSAAEIFLK